MPHSTIFVEEQNLFPPHIKALDTTQVLFIGYTKKYTEDETYPTINSLAEFITFYGDEITDVDTNFVKSYLYESIDLFFANGGRKCKIISINKNTHIVNIDIFINTLDELNNTNYNIVCCPDCLIFSHEESKDIHNKILKLCANNKSMYIIDLPLQYFLETNNSSYFDEKYLSFGAAYTPWIITSNNKGSNIFPVSAAIAGAWVNTDIQRGVWKNPSGISLEKVVDVAIQMSEADIINLNKNANLIYINPLRKFVGKGVVIWGGRTLAGNISNEWKYISTCRLIQHIENSIKHSLQWIIFEPNSVVTWNKAKQIIESFLDHYWRMGAFVGIKPEYAYFVQIGLGTTMTNFDIENGNINILIGLACVKPAEFNILKITFMCPI